MKENAGDMETADALWVLLKRQSREVRAVLEARLGESLRLDKPLSADAPPKADEASKKEEGQKGRYIPSKEAMEFVERLSVKGGEKVHPDERGVFLLC